MSDKGTYYEVDKEGTGIRERSDEISDSWCLRVHNLEETEIMGTPKYPGEMNLLMTLLKEASKKEGFLPPPPLGFSHLTRHSSSKDNPNVTGQEKVNEMSFPRTMISE